MNPLKRHPFAVVAWFDRVVALSFAFPERILGPLVPDRLEIDGYEGFGFVTVAMVWTRKLRPAGFPEFAGQDFFLAGYRIFTRLHDATTGRCLRGLRILRSDTDKRRMVWLGNLMTGYRYRLVRLRTEVHGPSIRVLTSLADGTPTLEVVVDAGSGDAGLPAGSPFPDWRTARRFAGPMPFTFSPEQDGSFTVIEGSRETWTPRPVAVTRWDVGLFRESPLNEATPVLANAFMVENVAYRWKKGRAVKPGGIP
jgi:Uncharacterized conserved protein (COG2071)